MINKDWKKDYKQIHIDSLYLDIKNPRTDSGEKLDYEKVTKELLEENTLELVESIGTKGYAAVTVLMVVEENGKNIVIDGNRRLLAVKTLNKPDTIKKFVTSSISQKNYERILELSKNKKEEIVNLTAIIYPNREIAEQEMAILHLDGESVQKWRPLRQYRYFKNQLNILKINCDELSRLLGIDFDRVKKGLITIILYEIAKNNLQTNKDFPKNIFDDKKFKTDKLQRAVVNTDGEKLLGYSYLENKNLIKINDKKIFLERLKKVLLELYKVDSQYLSSAQFSTKNRRDFFKTIEPTFFKKKVDEPDQDGLFEQPSSTVISERSKRKPSGLFFPSDVPYKLKNRTLQRLYDELKDISVYNFPNATHDLLRSFLECSLLEFLSEIGELSKIKKNEKHNPTLGELLTHVINNKVIKDQDVLDNLNNIKKDWDKPYSLQRMNMVNHNKNYASVESDVRIAWEKMEPLFHIILNSNKFNKKEEK